MGLCAPLSRILTLFPLLCCFLFLRVLGSCLCPLSCDAEPGVFEYRLGDSSSLRLGDFDCEAFLRMPWPRPPRIEAPFLAEDMAEPPWCKLTEAVLDLLALCC